MPYQDCQENWKIFASLLKSTPNTGDAHLDALVQRYKEQNMSILNDILTTSIKSLENLHHIKSANEIICTQAKFTSAITDKITVSAQRFVNASIGQASDYNEWLKAHCDFSTD
jgi:hypothetical protein